MKNVNVVRKNVFHRIKYLEGMPIDIKNVTYAVLWNCNSRCRTCNLWKNKYPKNLLSLEEISRIFSSKSMKNVESVYLTGGEPFLRTDIVEIVKIIHKNIPNAIIGFTTNALVAGIKEKVVEMLDSGVTMSFSISFNGPEKIHDYSRGIKGNHKLVVNLMKEVIEIENPRLKHFLLYIIWPFNAAYIKSSYRFAKELGTGIEYSFGRRDDRYLNSYSKPFIFTEKMIKSVDNQLRYLSSQKKHYYFLRYLFENYVINKKYFDCYGGLHQVNIDPYGRIYPCDSFIDSLLIGNIRKTQDFDRLWDSSIAYSVRKIIIDKKCQPCANICDISSSADFGKLKYKFWYLKRRFMA